MNYANLTKSELIIEKEKCLAALQNVTSNGLSLDLSRGKPSKEQLALSFDMLNVLNSESSLVSEAGTDCANYGGLDGISEAKKLMAEMLGTKADNVLIGGNSSLTLMYQILSNAMINGVCGSEPWSKIENRKFLCPVPGYDRHFAMTAHFGFELIPVQLNEDGPDMDQVEELIKDSSVKGIWCVPKYQNPTGIIFSNEVIKRFARLTPAATDFRIFWDNAYCVHVFSGENAEILDIISECEAAGNPDMVYEFCSTSKITFPGAGISAVASSKNNLNDIKAFLQFATIGPDKLNQLMHARYFGGIEGVKKHMAKHAEIIRPKFDAAYDVLSRELGDCGIASWTVANGGYFFSFKTMDGCAKKIVEMCGKSGVKFTPAGSTHPSGKDTFDNDIRIAPTFATTKEIEIAVTVLALHTKLVCIEKLLG